MKFPISWLKEYLATDFSVTKLSETLTNIGLEVEKLEDKREALKDFTVAKILAAKPHPNSTKLQICEVEVVTGEVLQIICGAKNARAQLKVIYAPIGSIIPSNQMRIGKAAIVGVESFGMLCSAKELGLGSDGEGIIEVDDRFAIGAGVAEVYDINEQLVEINVTPNRGDCLGIFGVARDLAAAQAGELKLPQISKTSAEIAFPFKAESNPDCSFAAFRYLTGIQNSESPKWLKDRLIACGLNPISLVVDVTSYIMLALGNPMHAYDKNKITGGIKIRYAKPSEQFTSLAKNSYALTEQALIVADEQKVLAVAGVIGSDNSGCDKDTHEIILEAACFNPISVAATAKKLGIKTDASYRFERGVNYQMCVTAIELATDLIKQICHSCKASEIVTITGKLPDPRVIKITADNISNLIGIKIPLEQISAILTRLGFGCEVKVGEIAATVPSHRYDIFATEDLIEEVIRIYGYDKISTSPLVVEEFPTKTQDQIRASQLAQARIALAANQLTEVITWSFINSKTVEESFAAKSDLLTIINPINKDRDHLRPNLITGLIESYLLNQVRGCADIALFEIGNVFSGRNKIEQRMMLAGIRVGKNKAQNHYNDSRDFDVYDVKKDIMTALAALGINKVSVIQPREVALNHYHPHRFALVQANGIDVGYFGELHPEFSKKMGAEATINTFEIDIESLSFAKEAKPRFKLNDLQPVKRDFAFIIPQDEPVGNLIDTIKFCEENLITKVEIFDIYQGEKISAGKKSVALRVNIQPRLKTMTGEEIERLSTKIISAVSDAHQAIIRDF